jgi:hypothetical protein
MGIKGCPVTNFNLLLDWIIPLNHLLFLILSVIAWCQDTSRSKNTTC